VTGKRKYDALDAVLMLALAARIHGTDAAVRATAKRILPKIPQADRHGIRRFLTTKYPLRVAELLLDCLVIDDPIT
jgi:hypothetical protein